MAIEKETALNALGVVLLFGALGVVGALLSGGGRPGGGGGLEVSPRGTTVVITAEQVQAKLQPAFPLSKRGPLGLSVELSDPTVVLKPDDDRIRLTTDANLKYPALTIKGVTLVASGDLVGGTATCSGALEYDPDAGALFFVRPKLDDLTVKGLHDKLLGPAETLCNGMLKAKAARIELYRLGTTWQERAAKLFVKQVQIRGGVIRIDLGLPSKTQATKTGKTP